MNNKYKVGDYVTIAKLFVVDYAGHFVDCDPFVAQIIKVEQTPTFGPAYFLYSPGYDFKICYWEEDICELAIQ